MGGRLRSSGPVAAGAGWGRIGLGGGVQMSVQVSQGGCLCGAVRFVATGPLRPVIFCHCAQCRRQTGLYYAATAVPKDCLAITDATALRWYAASGFARRGFCGTCGTALFWEGHELPHVSILAGALDDPSALTADCHIFTEGRPEFYALADGLPRHAREGEGIAVDGCALSR